MYRQFTSGGTERDVAKWLKEIGYRGQGLKKEVLLPLCRGEMTEYWEALIVSCRPAGLVDAMTRKLNLKLERQAILETRQKSKEESERMARRIKEINDLRQQSLEEEKELKRVTAQLQQMQSEVKEIDGVEKRISESWHAEDQRSQIIECFGTKMGNAGRILQRDTEEGQKNNQRLKKASGEEAPENGGMDDVQRVMQMMHDFTSQHFSRQLRDRRIGQLMDPESLIPRIESRPEIKNTAVSHFVSCLGQLYHHRTLELTQLFTAFSSKELFIAVQTEAKYARPTPVSYTDWDITPLKAIEEMQGAYLKAFISRSQEVERIRQHNSAFKRSSAVQRYLAAIEQSGLQNTFHYTLDAKCLRSDIATLNMEQEACQDELSKRREIEKETRQLYARMRGHVEHSGQMDIAIRYILAQIRHMQKEFDATCAVVNEQINEILLPAVHACLISLKNCQNLVSAELEAFSEFDLLGKPKQLSLSEPPPNISRTEHTPLQRLDTIDHGAISNYWASSLKEVMRELRLRSPLLSIDSPDELFRQISEACRTSLMTAHLHQRLLQHHDGMHEEGKEMQRDVEALTLKEQNHRERVEESVAKVDGLLSDGHKTVRLLTTEVSSAFEDLKQFPAFLSVPWMQRDGKSLSEWIAHRCQKHGG